MKRQAQQAAAYPLGSLELPRDVDIGEGRVAIQRRVIPAACLYAFSGEARFPQRPISGRREQ